MKIAKIRDVQTPQRGKGVNGDRSAGLDFFIPKYSVEYSQAFDKYNKTYQDDKGFIIEPNNSVLIPSGIKVNLLTVKGFNKTEHNGIMFKVDNKSGVAVKKSLVIGATIIDEDYQGEILINIHNIGTVKQFIEWNSKLTQIILIPIYIDDVEVVEENNLFETESLRGEGGFGSTNKQINLIVATNKNGVIGNNNDLVHSGDMWFFKQQTTNHCVVMGRKTFESMKSKPLSNRRNIVLTNQKLEQDGVEFMTYDEFIKMYHTIEQEIYVIGGAEIYHKFLDDNLIDVYYITMFDNNFDGNVKLNLDKISYAKKELIFKNNNLENYFEIMKFIK